MIKFSDVGQKMGWATLVRHQGLVIALAVDIGTNQISYRVLNVKPSVPDDDQNWSGLKQLSFPTQIRPAGMGLVTRDVGEAGTISKGDKAAFRACSDGRYVLVFRPSLDGTMLVDRFVLDPATLMLNPNIETRYQRSRKKDIPAGSKDSMGYEDMENQLFPEPTLELELSREIKGGNFAVILLQTSISSEWRWLIIAGNDSKNQLDFFSIHRASDGLFDMGDVLETNIFLETEGGQIFSPLVGLDALLYAEQESLKDDYGRSQRLKRGLRLMLAAAPQDANFPLAVLDFAVTRDGGLTRVPDESRLTLPELDLDKDEAVLPALYVDIQGTELRGGLLKPAYSKAAPFLMDGTDGLVHLYYPSRQTELQTDTLEEGQFMVAQYDTGTARARIDLPLLPAEKGTAQMTGFRSGAALNDATLTIRAGDDPEHCTVLLACDAGKTQEIWRDVPRRLDRFAAVLNGDTTPDVRDPRVEKGEMVAYDAALKRQFISQHLAYLAYDLPAGIGAVRFETWQPVVQEQSGVIIAVSNGSKRDLCTVTLQLKVDPAETAKPVIETWQDVPRGVDDFIRLLSGLFTTDPQDPQVKYGSKLLYDAAAKAKSSDPDVDLRSGSGLFKFQNRGASEQIQNQEIERRAFDHPGSLLFGVVTGISEVDAVLIQVNNVEQALVKEKGSDARWIPEPLGHMLKFSQGSYLDIQQDQLPERDFQGDLSMEAWVNPGVSSGGVQRILHMQRSEKARCFLGLKQEVKDGKTYFLAHAGSQNLSVLAKDKIENRIHPGVWSHVVAVLNTNNALELDGKGYVDCGNETALRLVDALTVEAWVEPKTVNAAGVIASKWGSTEKDQSWKLSITSEGYPCFSVRDSVNVRTWRLMAKEKIKENVLTHLAGVLDIVPRQETALSLDPAKRQYVYMNGTGLKGGNQPHTIEAWLWLDEYPQKGKRAWILNLGKQSGGTGDHHWLVKSDGSTQLGPWDGVQHISPLPLKQWTHVVLCFDGNQLTCYFNGVQQGAPKQCKFNLGKEKLIIGAHPIPIPLTPFVKADVERYWKGKINNLRVWDKALSPEQVRENMFKKPSEVTGAVGSWAFDAVDKLLNEVIDKAGRNKGILSGNPDFVEVDKGLYRMQLYVNGICQSWTWLCISEGNLTMGKLLSSSGGKYKVSVIGTWPDLKVGDILMAPDPGGTRGEEQIEVLQLGPPDPISVITLVTKRQVHGTPAFKHVDSQAITITTNANVWVDTPDGDSRKNEFKLAKIADTETKVCIGAEASGTSAFQGLIDEVRIWNLGRSEPQIMAYMNDPLPVDAKGLVAWWSFDEGQDRRAEDLKGTSHGRLIHADEKILKENKLWAPSTRNAQ
ncbi:MAG TPA: LamG-like jellyroll fold domain-containing protein, partial [Anaerolineales bacterium]|nr:LamG-like jellyroll fold domain-containing protein [Anaerolineales bacterium]